MEVLSGRSPQEPQVAQQLAELRKGYAALTPEDIRCIDPCMGSGHILAYLFDVLMQIYRSAGYGDRDAAASIVEHNLYGLDIDDRAAQMAYFVVMMKGCQYDSRFLRRHLNPHVYAIQESGKLTTDALGRLGKQESTARTLLDTFKNAKEYGSILQPKVTLAELDALQEQLREVDGASDMGSLTDQLVAGQIVNVLYPLIEQARMLVQKYDVVVTNPPYMGASNMNPRLNDFIKNHYPDSKSDLFAVFIERCAQMDKRGGYQAMITQHAWMFLSSFEKLRAKLQLIDTVNMAHLGARGFDEIGGEVVQTTSFVMRSSHTKGYKGTYCRLIDGDSEKAKAEMFVSGENRYVAEQDNFSKIPGSPIGYWISNTILNDYDRAILAGKIAQFKHGMSTGKNEAVVRLWYEVAFENIKFDAKSHDDLYESNKKYVPYNKGGEYRKWYGNKAYVLAYDQEADALMDTFPGHRHDNKDTYFRKCISWSKVTSGGLAMRFFEEGFVYDVAGCSAFTSDKYIYYLLAFYNLKVKGPLVASLSPTLNFEVGQLQNSPIIYDEEKEESINNDVEKAIDIEKSDWDSFETSWDFKHHPLV